MSIDFEISIADFDISLLPFDPQLVRENPQLLRESVQRFFESRLSALGGSTRVLIDEARNMLRVSWSPVNTDAIKDLLDYSIKLLQTGRIDEAVPFLQLIVSRLPNNVDALYNYGMVLSDKGNLDQAIAMLSRATQVSPDFANAWCALGVAYARLNQLEQARTALEKALTLEPANGYALRNIGAIASRQGDLRAAKGFLETAVEQLPDDPASHLGLGQVLFELNEIEKADTEFLKVLDLAPSGDMAETARSYRNKIAGQSFRQKGVRMDAVMYCLSGLQKFSNSPDRAQEVGFEIALLGRQGLNVNDPAQQYTLRSMAGKFSGLHLVCLMYVAFKIIKPDADIGFDLSNEYAEAQRLYEAQREKDK